MIAILSTAEIGADLFVFLTVVEVLLLLTEGESVRHAHIWDVDLAARSAPGPRPLSQPLEDFLGG